MRIVDEYETGVWTRGLYLLDESATPPGGAIPPARGE